MYELHPHSIGGLTIHLGSVVSPAEDLISVQSPEGDQIPVRSLGPGIVEEIENNCMARVRWLDAGFSAWMQPADIRPLAPSTHLISLYNQYNAAVGTQAQEAILQQMQDYIDNQAYYVTFSVSDMVYFHSSNVTGVDVSSAEPILNLYTLKPAS